MTPRRAIREHCLDCCLGSATEVANCTVTECILYSYRNGHRNADQTMTPLKAIRAYCLACGEPGNYASVRDCKIENCKLHQFRFGHNPSLKGHGNHQVKMPKTSKITEPTVGFNEFNSKKGM